MFRHCSRCQSYIFGRQAEIMQFNLNPSPLIRILSRICSVSRDVALRYFLLSAQVIIYNRVLLRNSSNERVIQCYIVLSIKKSHQRWFRGCNVNSILDIVLQILSVWSDTSRSALEGSHLPFPFIRMPSPPPPPIPLYYLLGIFFVATFVAVVNANV